MIQNKLFSLPSFQKQYRNILILSVSESIPALEWSIPREELLHEIDWNNVLGIASILAYSEQVEHLDAALRIAQTCIGLNETNETQKNAAAVILGNLTNKQAIQLAVNKGLVSENFFDELPLPLAIQKIRSDIENSILITGKVVGVNRFQKDVYEKIQDNDVVSISAPTSAGKSFILCHILLDALKEDSALNIVYIVPTRALISQVEADLLSLLAEYNISSVSVSTVPQADDNLGSNIFVFTQERLHWFLSEKQGQRIDIMIVDEAQKIDDGYRGMLLQQKIEETIASNPAVKVYFSSPFTSNPEILLENIATDGKKATVNTQFVAVNQNLIYISQVPKKVQKFKVQLCRTNETIELGFIGIRDRAGTSELKGIALIAESFDGGKGGNLIYSNGSAAAEDLAEILFNILSEKSRFSQNIDDLIDLIKKTIHPKYALAKVLKKGIAFHYGNMPLLIRQEIEKLFKSGEIDYLICTSTLLEGVNLPAKSIFIRKPNRGKGTPLNQNDFWNLAGRAGRLGKEFSGNIICVNPDHWDIQPSPNKRKQNIVRAIDFIKNERSTELIGYIRRKSPRDEAISNQDLEFAFGYFYTKYLDGLLTGSSSFYLELRSEFETLKENIHIPDAIIKRNSGISPIAQQGLYDYFKNKIGTTVDIGKKREIIESLIPVYPEDESAYEEYMKLIGRIGKTLTSYPSILNSSRAIMVTGWMKGHPLAYIIDKSIASYKKSGKDKKIATIIREVMNDIESFVRFQFARDSGCYVDILRYFIETEGMTDLKQSIPDLNLWLEFGVNQQSHLSLLGLGLSRNSVIDLGEYVPKSSMTKMESLQWLKTLQLEGMNLHPLVVEDIRKTILKR